MTTTRSKIRVAYIDHTGEMGGAEHLLLSLLCGLPEEAVEPLLICVEDGPFPAEAKQHHISTMVIPLPALHSLSWLILQRKVINPFAVLWDLVIILLAARRIKQYLLTTRVDLVQTNSVFAHIYGGLAARMVGVPCVWYFHDLVESRRLAGSIAFLWRVLATCLATRVVGVSRAVVDSLSVGSRGCVIYAGSKGGAGSSSLPGLRVQLALPDEAKLVGYVGRIAYAKGLDILARSALKIVQSDPLVHFVVLGEATAGETSYKRTLMAAIEGMRLSDNWHWLGYDSQAAARISELDLLVLPSRREALGLVLLEAGSASKAAVASRVGGIPEVIIDGETGILVSPDNPEELASVILQLAKDPRMANELGRKANARVK